MNAAAKPAPRLQYPVDIVFESVAKTQIGRRPPYPVYRTERFEFPSLRVNDAAYAQKRQLEYVLYGAEPRIGCNFWLVCLDDNGGRTPDKWGIQPCMCCPPMTQAEHGLCCSIVTRDAGRPGEPYR